METFKKTQTENQNVKHLFEKSMELSQNLLSKARVGLG
jgi:hypothetical protein